jgi:hypothetical protein
MAGSGRTFLITAAATFFGGIALLIVEPIIFQDQRNIVGKELSIENFTPIALNGPAQQKISDYLQDSLSYKELKDVPPIKAGVARVKNKGNSDIADFEIKVVSSVRPEAGDFVAAGLIDEDGDTDDFIPIDVGDGAAFDIPVDVIKPEETVQFFYVMSPFNISHVSVREAGVDIVDAANDSGLVDFEDFEGFSNILYILLFSVASFLLGIGIRSAFHDEMIRKFGFDPKEFMEAYKAADRNDKLESRN